MDHESTEVRLLGFLKESPQFVIPIPSYQRTCSWSEVECSQFWDDTVRTGRNPAIGDHFIGSVVYVAESLVPSQPSSVITGQQRLASITRFLPHTLGNLTLTGRNSGCGNRPLTKKRYVAMVFRNGPLRINDGLAN